MFKEDIKIFIGSGKFNLYHASRGQLQLPVRYDFGQAKNDFGQGFYMAENPLRSKTFACSSDNPFFYELEVDFNGLNCVHFEKSTWAMFVAFNREKINPRKFPKLYEYLGNLTESFDIISGPISDDRLYGLINKFLSNSITDQAFYQALKGLNLGLQYVSKTPLADSRITILSETKIPKNEILSLREIRNKNNEKGELIGDEMLDQWLGVGKYFTNIMKEFEMELENDESAIPTL